MPQTVVIPPDQIKQVTCTYCDHVSDYAIIDEAWPHLYCTRCNNVYHEKINERDYDKIRTDWGRRKKMSLVESRAPLCECGGLFLFNAHPNCPNCGLTLPFMNTQPDTLERIKHDRLIVTHDTLEYQNDGTSIRYTFSK